MYIRPQMNKIFTLVFFLLLPTGPDGQEVLLVNVPDFSSTQTACLVNLRTLECEPVRFSAFSADDDEESEMNISHWGSISTYNMLTLFIHCVFRLMFPDRRLIASALDQKTVLFTLMLYSIIKVNGLLLTRNQCSQRCQKEKTSVVYKQAFIWKITLLPQLHLRKQKNLWLLWLSYQLWSNAF